MRATVYKSTGSWYTVKTTDGQAYQARIKGVFKLDDITSTNPLAVGDEVELALEEGPETAAMVTEIYDRRNYITRQSPSNRMQRHIVAANLDQAMVFATLREPRTSQGFIDRFLVTCEAYHVPALIVFNKTDLFRSKEQHLLHRLREVYEGIGYRVFETSVAKQEGLEAVRAALKEKTTLISGHSGVGKSSFINTAFPSFRLKTGDVSGWSGKGMHTTTFAEMFDLPGGGRLIDTPGIREFGIVDIDKPELSHYFPEMRALLNDCQFNNCLHTNEPDCAVKDAVLQGKIDEERYFSYLNILDSLETKY